MPLLRSRILLAAGISFVTPGRSGGRRVERGDHPGGHGRGNGRRRDAGDGRGAGATAAGTGSSQRLTPRPAGTTDAPLGYMEYLPPDYDDDESSPLLVALQGFDKSGPGTEVALHKVLGEGIPRL